MYMCRLEWVKGITSLWAQSSRKCARVALSPPPPLSACVCGYKMVVHARDKCLAACQNTCAAGRNPLPFLLAQDGLHPLHLASGENIASCSRIHTPRRLARTHTRARTHEQIHGDTHLDGLILSHIGGHQDLEHHRGAVGNRELSRACVLTLFASAHLNLRQAIAKLSVTTTMSCYLHSAVG